MGAQPPPASVVIGRYALHGEIAAGGMATVHFGRLVGAVGFSRIVAIKRLHPHLAKDKEFTSMFLDEARLAARVRHPNVVPLLDVAAMGEEVLLVMEYVPGVPLASLLRAVSAKGELVAPDVAAAVVCGVLHGLHAAHEATDEAGAPLHIVHRDVSPQNILVGVDGVPRVLDFGVAKAEGRMHTTRDGTLKGKLAYMAPEQLRGEADRRTDVYAAAVVLWEALTSRRLFKGENEAEIFAKVLTAELEPPSAMAAEVPAALDGIVSRGLSRDPETRFQTAREMALALEAAVPIANPTRVSEWVTELARETLAWRAGTVAAMEKESSSARLDMSAEGRRIGSEDATSQLTLHAGTVTSSQQPPAPASRWRPAFALTSAILLAVAAVAAIVGGRVWRARVPAATPPGAAAVRPDIHLPARVLVLGIENRTGDPVFSGTLDDILSSALGRSSSIRPEAGVRLRNSMAGLMSDSQQVDESAARRLAARDGGTVITVRGAVVSKGAGYALSIAAIDAVTGALIFSQELDATDGSRVVPTTGLLACALRRSLGDEAPSDPGVAEQTGMSGVVEADYESTLAHGFSSLGKYEEGILHLRRALVLDPGFVKVHVALGVQLRNLGRNVEGLREFEVALKNIDQLGERERLGFLGNYYTTVGNYTAAAASYEDLLGKVPDDLGAETALPGVYARMRDTRRGLDIARRAAADHPMLVATQSNLASALLLAGDVDAAAERARRVVEGFPRPLPHAYVVLAVAEALRGQVDDAKGAYDRLSAHDPALALIGAADLALSEGRVADAANMLEPDPTGTDAQGTTGAARWAMLAETRLLRGNRVGAVAAAREAAASGEPPIVYAAASTLIAAGQSQKAMALLPGLGPGQDGSMYGRLLVAEVLLVAHKPREAAAHMESARQLSDSWLVHADLARADLALGDKAGAARELDTCAARRGEGALTFGDDAPSVRLVSRTASLLGPQPARGP